MGDGPPNKWNKMKISTTSDPNAQTSDQVLECLNEDYPVNGSFAATCSDGTFAFIGIYGS